MVSSTSSSKRSKKKRKGDRAKSSSGSLGMMRSGFKGIVGGKTGKKESRWGNVITYALILAAALMLLYRLKGR